jgi:hypothetical protein
MAGFPPIDQLYYDNPSPMAGSWLLIRLRQEVFYQLLRLHNRDKSSKDLFDLCFSFASNPSNAATLDPLLRELVEQKLRRNTLLELDPARAQKAQPSDFASLADLHAFLREKHNPSFRYRGQTKRYQTTYKGEVPGLASRGHLADPVTIKFEGLVPTLFRPVVQSSPAEWDNYRYPSKLAQIAPALRAIMRSDHQPLRSLVREYFKDVVDHPGIFAKYTFAGHSNLKLPESTMARFARGTMTPNTLLRIISVAQHYELGSVMVDITNDVEVAVWFATHLFGSGDLARSEPDERGVIYRFNAESIQKFVPPAVEVGAREPSRFPFGSLAGPAGLIGITDIADLDGVYGKRPKAQAGGSILGLENSSVYLQADLRDAIEVFTFPLSTITGRETSLKKEDLCPPDDPSEKVLSPANASETREFRDDEISTFLVGEGFSNDDIEKILTLRRDGAI